MATMKPMLRRLLISALVAPLAVFSARADIIGFDPPESFVELGDVFNVSIVGLDVASLAGGTIDLGYDDTVVEILNVAIDAYWDFQPDPGAKDEGTSRWLDIGFDTFVNDPASGDFTIAVLELEAVGLGTSPLEILPTSQFFSATEQLDPGLDDGSVVVTPLPVAFWLMVSAFGGLAAIGYRRRAA